jgi:hypothetical protein
MGRLVGALTHLPLIGSIDGSLRARPPMIDHPTLGRSVSRAPTVVRFRVDDRRRMPAGVGRLAKQTLFADLPPFTCSVAFACGPIRRTMGSYADPSSPWFNVFTGVYEVLAERVLWAQPFGYGDGRPSPEHVIRLGVADWNYFSAHLYGVPLADLASEDALDGVRWWARPHPAGDVPSGWDRLEIEGVGAPDPSRAQPWWVRGEPSRLWRGLWQFAFGRPAHRSTSSRPSVMRARVLMCAYSDARVHRTLVLGATANTTHPDDAAVEALLDAQFQSIEHLARTRYGHYGRLERAARRCAVHRPESGA